MTKEFQPEAFIKKVFFQESASDSFLTAEKHGSCEKMLFLVNVGLEYLSSQTWKLSF